MAWEDLTEQELYNQNVRKYMIHHFDDILDVVSSIDRDFTDEDIKGAVLHDPHEYAKVRDTLSKISSMVRDLRSMCGGTYPDD